MHSELETLDTLLKDNAKVNCDEKAVKLVEPKAPDSKIIIGQIPKNAVLIKCDEFEAPTRIFKGGNGECKRCDYIFLFPYQNNKYALFIEMKRGNPSNKNAIIQQLIGGRCFLDYCDSILKHFHKIKKPLNDYKSRYVCFTRTQIDKKPIKQRRRKARLTTHMSPEKFLKISSERRVPLTRLF